MRSTRPSATLCLLLSAAALGGLVAVAPGTLHWTDRRGDAAALQAPQLGRLRPSLFEQGPSVASTSPLPTAPAPSTGGDGDFPDLSALVAAGLCGLGAAAGLAFRRHAGQRCHDRQAGAVARDGRAGGLPGQQDFVDRLAARPRAADAGPLTGIFAVHIDTSARGPVLPAADSSSSAGSPAERLRAACGPDALACALGTDALLVAEPGLCSVAEAAARAQAIRARLIRSALRRPGENVESVSVGVAVGTDVPALVQAAEVAMRQARAEEGGGLRACHPGVEAALRRCRRLEDKVRQAASGQGLILTFEPVFDSRTAQLTGFTMLPGLFLGGTDTISPGEFDRAAEDLGLAQKVRDTLLARACEAAARWPEPLGVALSLSPGQMAEAGLCGAVATALGASGLAARRLALEIGEVALAACPERAAAQIGRLRALGVRVTLEIAGLGAAGLDAFWRCRFDRLKIAAPLVGGLGAGDARSVSLLRTILTLGQHSGTPVGAGGVETARQAEILKSIGCDHLQGNALGRPMAEGDLLRAARAGCVARIGRREAYVFKGRFGSLAA